MLKTPTCDWCGGPLLKLRNDVLKLVPASNNAICDKCWGEHIRQSH